MSRHVYTTTCPRCGHKFVSVAPYEGAALCLAARTMDAHYLGRDCIGTPWGAIGMTDAEFRKLENDIERMKENE